MIPFCISRVLGFKPMRTNAANSQTSDLTTSAVFLRREFALGRSDYQRQYEPILYGWAKGSDHFWCGARDQGDVWHFDWPVRNDLHPTMKPIALVERAIRNLSRRRAIPCSIPLPAPGRH
jgi:DNA modification methylase